MVRDARTIEQLDTTRVLLSKRSTSPIDQQPFSSRLFHSQTPKLAKSSATQNLPLFALNRRIISSRSCAWHNCSPAPQRLELAPWAYYAEGARLVPDPRVGDAAPQGPPQRSMHAAPRVY